jgi:acyl-CoA thioesterase FadM
MQNYVILKPRFSDFNSQGLLKASTHLDLACESQLEQMSARYNLPLPSFSAKGLRWHIADFKISYPKAIKGLSPIRIEADVVGVEAHAMIVDFAFFDEAREQKFAYGTLKFDLVGKDDMPVVISSDVKESLVKYGKIK